MMLSVDEENEFNNDNMNNNSRRSRNQEKQSSESTSFFLSKQSVINALKLDEKNEVRRRRGEEVGGEGEEEFDDDYSMLRNRIWKDVLTVGDVDRLLESYQNQLVYMNTMLRNTENKELFLRLNYNNYLVKIVEGKSK